MLEKHVNVNVEALKRGLGLGLVFLLVLLATAACSGPPEFKGTVLEPPEPAADFALQDQHGATFRLSDAHDEVVVMAFLYTSCVDTCPFIGAKLKQTSTLLGDSADRVAFVVISTDPERDTRERVAEYSRALGMDDRWQYLIGPWEELEPVWQAYYVAAPVIEEDAVGAEQISDEQLRQYGLVNGLDEAAVQQAKRIAAQFGGGYDVGHSTPVWLIDTQGQIRVKHGQDLVPADLADDIRQLLKQG
jgi:cytochrome oxidase Cu insertion factor (SCO1/SenC/PrrC family)